MKKFSYNLKVSEYIIKRRNIMGGDDAPVLELTKLYTNLSYAEKQGLLGELEKIYARLPETSCDKCATCCTVPPPGYLVEFLNLYKYVKDYLPGYQQYIMENTVRFFFLELAEINIKCPFLGESNNCLVYPARPLGCRVYGLLSEEDFKLGARRELSEIEEKYREKHGIELPAEVVNFELPFCDRVQRWDGKNGSRKYISVELVQSLATEIEGLEGKIMPPQVLEEHYTFVPMATHLALSVLSKGARLRRPKVIKEYLEKGSSELLEEYVAKFGKHQF